MGKRLTYEFVKEQFEKEGYELLSKEYINNREKLKYICSNRHKHSISWGNWKTGCRCPHCSGKVKKTIEYIGSQFEKEKYILLTKVYKNAHQKLEYICPEGHRRSISWSKWQRGHRCPYCSGKFKKTIDFIRPEFKNEGYKLLSEEYVNAHTKLKYICPNGHRHEVSWSKWQQGKRCPECYYLSMFGFGNSSWRGGIKTEPYCDAWADKEYKESIKERDSNKCQNPDCWGTSERLTIHHIDYVKKNCRPENLITLCASCNSRANKDREWHTSYYKEIVRRRNLANEL